jgi:hypothetical protein
VIKTSDKLYLINLLINAIPLASHRRTITISRNGPVSIASRSGLDDLALVIKTNYKLNTFQTDKTL